MNNVKKHANKLILICNFTQNLHTNTHTETWDFLRGCTHTHTGNRLYSSSTHSVFVSLYLWRPNSWKCPHKCRKNLKTNLCWSALVKGVHKQVKWSLDIRGAFCKCINIWRILISIIRRLIWGQYEVLLRVCVCEALKTEAVVVLLIQRGEETSHSDSRVCLLENLVIKAALDAARLSQTS